jgi:hypothetical protein
MHERLNDKLRNAVPIVKHRVMQQPTGNLLECVPNDVVPLVSSAQYCRWANRFFT